MNGVDIRMVDWNVEKTRADIESAVIWSPNFGRLHPLTVAIREIKKKLSEKFVARDLGPVRHFLNCKIDYDIEAGHIRLSQTAYINQLNEIYRDHTN